MNIARFRLIVSSIAILGLTVLAAMAGGEKELLAPTGSLRVGVYQGSPTSMVTDPRTGQIHGLTHDLGEELARRLGVSVEYVTLPRIADVIDAIKAGRVDFTVSNATPARAQDVDFSQTLISIELGYLVPRGSPVTRVDDIDRPGVRIGVTRGGTSERTLSAKFKNATIVPAESVKLAIEMLERGELDVYATNKALLFEMSDALTGAHILEGNWGFEHMAIAIPKQHSAGMESLRAFVGDVQSSGLLAKLQQLAGLRGAVIETPAK